MSLPALFPPSAFLPRSALVSPSTLPSLSAPFLLSTLLPRSVLFAPSTPPSLSILFLLSTLLPLSALFLPAPPPSSAAAPWRAVSHLFGLWLRLTLLRACVVSGYRAFVRQQPDFDLGRFPAEAQNPGTAGINDGYFYVFELDAEGV